MVMGSLLGGMAGGAVVSVIINGIDNFSGTFARAAGGIKGLGTVATLGAGAVAAVGIAAGVTAAKSVSAFNDVEDAYSAVNTLLDDGVSAQEEFAGVAEHLNTVMGNQGDQIKVLEGLYQTVSAGITDTAEATEFMEAATKAAVGGHADLPTVILAGTKAMAAFGEGAGSAENVMDLFSATVKAGQTTMGELAGSFPRVAGTAAGMGASMEETLGVFAGLTKVLGSSEETATSLNAVFTQMLKPQEKLQSQMQSLGFENGKAMVESLGLMGSLEALNESVDGDVTSLGEMFGNVRAIKAVFPALGTAADDVAASMDILNDAIGLSQKQFNDVADTAQYKMGAAMSEVKNQFIEVGGSLSETLMPLFVDLMTLLNEKLLPAFLPLVEKVGPLLVGLFEFMEPIIIQVMEAMGKLSAVFSETFGPYIEKLKPILQELIEKLVDTGTQITEALMPAFEAIMPVVMQVVEALMPMIPIIADIIVQVIKFGAHLIEKLMPILSGIIGVITWLLDLFLEWAGPVLSKVIDALSGLIDYLSDAWDWFKKIINVMADVGAAIADSPIGDIVSMVFSKVKKLFGLATGGIVTQPIMSMVGEAGPEAVIPLDKLQQFMTPSSGGGPTYNVYVTDNNIYGTDPDDIADALQDRLTNMVSI